VAERIGAHRGQAVAQPVFAGGQRGDVVDAEGIGDRPVGCRPALVPADQDHTPAARQAGPQAQLGRVEPDQDQRSVRIPRAGRGGIGGDIEQGA
jgi:hypothetical protein